MTLFYRTASLYRGGDRIHPGNWGRVILATGGAHNLFLRECLFEHLRATEFPERPSRLSAAFAFENLAFAQNWNRGVLAERVYPVTAEPDVLTFRGDMSLLDFVAARSYVDTVDRIRRYWTGEILSPEQAEVLVAGDLIVGGDPIGP